jgi:transcriptional regulator with XRE-family HTH domain
MSINKRIKELREKHWPSREAFADACGVVWQTVQQWEKEGGTAPKRGRLGLVATLLKTTPEYLMTGREPGQKSDALQFTELSGLEAQLVMLYRSMTDDGKHDLLVHANEIANRANPNAPGPANPFPGVEKAPSKSVAKKK